MSVKAQKKITAAEFMNIFLVFPYPLEFSENISSDQNSIEYSDLEIVDDLLIDRSVIYDEARLSFNNIVFKALVLKGQRPFKNLEFNFCEVQESITYCIESISMLMINRCTIIGKLRFEGNKSIEHLNLNALTCDILAINATAHFNIIQIDGCKITKLSTRLVEIANLIIRNNSRIDQLSLSGNIVKSDIDTVNLKSAFINATGQNLYLLNITLDEKIHFGTLKMENIHINKLRGNGKGKINLAKLSTNLIEITETKIAGLDIGKIDEINKIVVKQCEISSLTFNDTVVTTDKLYLEDIKIPERGELSIQGCSLGPARFIRCSFDSAIGQFDNSKIQDIYLAETDFPQIIISRENQPNYSHAQLLYGQLQVAYSKMGDSIRVQDYQSRELEAHYHVIPWIIKKYSLRWKMRYPVLNLTKLSLCLNYMSNTFGRNWGQAVLFTIACGFFFFLLLILSTAEYRLGFSWHSDLFGAFLKFMNPLRQFNIKEMFEKPRLTLNSWSYLWDFIGRIMVAYGYYQTIQAFRRYGKNK